MLLGLLIQQVEEVLDGKRHGAAGAENHLEQVVHELLQGALWEAGSTGGGTVSKRTSAPARPRMPRGTMALRAPPHPESCKWWSSPTAQTDRLPAPDPSLQPTLPAPPSWTAGESGRSQGWPWLARAPRPEGCPSGAWEAPAPHWASPGARAGCPPRPHPPALGSLCQDAAARHPSSGTTFPGPPGSCQLPGVEARVEGFSRWKGSRHQPTLRCRGLCPFLGTGQSEGRGQ